jgi:H+-transporting ATPase
MFSQSPRASVALEPSQSNGALLLSAEGESKDEPPVLKPTAQVIDVKEASAEPEGRADTAHIRKSLSLIQEYHAPDARKSIELPPSEKQFRPSVELRRSLSRSESKGNGELQGVKVEGTAPAPLPVLIATPKAEEITQDKGAEAKDDKRPTGADGGHGEPSEAELLKTFPISEGLTTAQAADLLEKYGRNELPEKVTPKWLIFCSLLWQPMPVMIWVAAIVEIIIANYPDMAILIAINLINASLSYYESTKAGDAVAALKASLKPTAICFRDGKWNNQFDARLLVPGDLIELASGAAVPADCMLNHGTIDTDESAMTGESLPVTLHEREMAKMGGTVARGETHATVVFTGKNTFFGKTASMLGNSTGRSNLQVLLLKIIIILCVLAFCLVLSAFIFLLAGRGVSLRESASFAVVVIVASIPMAVEIVTTTTLAIGSKQLSRFGAIVSRLAAIDDLAGLNMLCSDKTGTLTKNKMTIQDDAPAYEPNTTQMDLLKQSALAARWQSPPKDALDTLFLRCHLWHPNIKEALAQYAQKNPTATQAQKDEFYNHEINEKLQEALADYESLDFMPFDPRIKRTESTVRVKSTGAIFKITKGAPHVLHALDKDEVKGEKMMAKVTELGEDGIRAVAIAISEPINDQWVEGAEEQHITPVWHITGMLTFLDPPRDDTKDTIARSQAYGVPVRMITGDHILIAKKTCKDLAMGNMDKPNWPTIQGPSHLPILDENGKPPADLVKNYGAYISEADGFAQVFPEHKFLVVETFRQLGYKCGMTGDGVNDAPALKRADVGIAVAGATDAARAAADIVLTQEGLSTIILGIEISRCIFARMKSFLTYRTAATLQLLTFFFIAVFTFNPQSYANETHSTNASADTHDWPMFFSLPVIFLMIITLINDGTLISVGYDHAVPSKYPERWVLPILFIVSISLGAIACLSSLILLHFCLTSWEPTGLFQQMGIGGLNYGQIVNVIFLKVAVSDILTLFSARTAHQFFFQRKPHPVLFICALIALSLSTTLALAWPEGTLDDVPVCGLGYHGQKIALWVWIYCLVVFVIQDAVKVATWRVILHYNFLNVNNEVQVKNDDANAIELEPPEHNAAKH